MTADSPISQEAFDRVNRKNECLSHQIGILTNQVQQLLAAQRRPPPSSSPAAPPAINVEQIVFAMTKSVLTILQQHVQLPTLMASATSRHSSGLASGDSSTRSNNMDTSFDSTTLDSHVDS
ncbi:hypothetical protein ACA910_016487 [Epithemia clementina (nom. ined.)]